MRGNTHDSATQYRTVRTAATHFRRGFLLMFAVLSHSEWRWLGLLGVIPLMTGLTGWCALYQLLGIGTRDREI